MNIKRVKSAFLFDNGNLAACDENGHQIPELQGSYSIEKHQRIVLEATDDCEFKGFNILPFGFRRTVEQYCNYFKERNISWEEIQEL